MEQIEKAIEGAYTAQITAMYNILSQGILEAKGDAQEKAAAQDRFRKGLEFAAEVRASARAAAGL